MFAIKENLPMIVTALIVLAIVFLFREVASLKKQLSDIVMVEVEGQDDVLRQDITSSPIAKTSPPSTSKTPASTTQQQSPKDDTSAPPAVILQQQQ